MDNFYSPALAERVLAAVRTHGWEVRESADGLEPFRVYTVHQNGTSTDLTLKKTCVRVGGVHVAYPVFISDLDTFLRSE